MNADSVKIKLIADLKGFTANMKQASRLVTGFGQTASKSLGLASRAFGRLTSTVRRLSPYTSIGLAGISAAIIKVGADAEEAENLFGVAFESMAGDVRKWSEDLAARLKLSATGLRETAGNFQIFLTGLDLSAGAAKKMSTALTELTYDMASLRNQKFDVALQKIQAGLAGEVEPLRRLGITVSNNTMKQWALKRGLDANTESWSEQQKVVARTGIIFDALQRDMGDLARTSDSTTNLLRSIKDQFRETAIEIYEKWKPAVEASLKSFRDWLLNNRDTIAKWAGKVGAYVVYVKDVFLGFVDILRESPKEGFTVLLRSLVEVMKAAAKIAIDLAVRIGKGIWQGVKDGIWGDGPSENDIGVRARELYTAAGGTYQPGAKLGSVRVDQEKWLQARQQAEEELLQAQSQKITEPIMKGFGASALEALRGIGEGAAESSTKFASQIEEANAKLQKSLAAVEAGAEDAGDATAEAGQQVAAGMDGASAAAERNKKIIDNLTAAWGRTGAQMKAQASKWASMWERTASGIAGSFEDMFVSIVDDVRSATDVIESLLSTIQQAISRAMFQEYMLPSVFSAIRSIPGIPSTFGSSLQQAPTVQQGTYTSGAQAVGLAHGGIVQQLREGLQRFAQGGLVYASSGLFTPKGTDTVPAMLTPGEGVLDAETTSRLRKVLQVPEPSPAASRPVNINISAIDAAGTYQFLQKNKRALASMLGASQQANHPVTRARR